MDVLRVHKLNKSFKSYKAVTDVSINVGPGEVVGLLGPNGAGKSTTFKMACGIVQPDSGSVFLGEEDVTSWPMFLRAKEGGMGYLPQASSIFRKLTVEQNISAILELQGYPSSDRRQRTEELLELLQISEHRKILSTSLSGGLERRLEVARALVSNPKIIMLDEPFAGVDPKARKSMGEIILQLKKQGISFLITDHNASEVLKISDRCYLLDQGKVICSGYPEEVRRDAKAVNCYFADDEKHGDNDARQRVDSPTGQAGNVPPPKRNLIENSALRRRIP